MDNQLNYIIPFGVGAYAGEYLILGGADMKTVAAAALGAVAVQAGLAYWNNHGLVVNAVRSASDANNIYHIYQMEQLGPFVGAFGALYYFGVPFQEAAMIAVVTGAVPYVWPWKLSLFK